MPPNSRGNPKTGQICWRCAKACGGCSWSADLTPVPGWIAEKRSYPVEKGMKETSYIIRYCPEFEKEER